MGASNGFLALAHQGPLRITGLTRWGHALDGPDPPNALDGPGPANALDGPGPANALCHPRLRITCLRIPRTGPHALRRTAGRRTRVGRGYGPIAPAASQFP
jgi:hypothetical protein